MGRDPLALKSKELNIQDPMFGVTPLMQALTKPQANITAISAMLDKGANIHVQDNLGRDALMYALERKPNPTIIRMLLDKETDVNLVDYMGTPLLHGALRNYDVLKMILDAGADPKARTASGRTPLFGYGTRDEKILKLLLERGVDINAQDAEGDTVLMETVSFGENNWTKILLKYGANPTIKNKSGLTAFDLAPTDEIRQILTESMNK